MTTFLISGMGGDMAQCIARIIRTDFPGSKIIGLDMSERNAARLFCDDFLISPAAVAPGYVGFIEKLIGNSEVDFFVPCTEHELRVIKELPSAHMIWKHLIALSKDILDVCLDKHSTFVFLKNHQIKVPWFSLNAGEIVSFPCIYKKRSSSGSRDIFKVKTKEEALFLEKFSTGGIFQEYLAGDDEEYTCSVFQWDDGTCEVIQLQRVLTGGSTSWAKVVAEPAIQKLCKDVADAFHLKGSLNLQLRMVNGEPMIFEINPRFSSTVYMRHLLGYKDFVWSVKKLKGEELGKIIPVTPGKMAAKISEIAIL